MDILVISKNDNKNNWIDSKDIDNNINVNFYFIESFDDLNKIKTIDLMKFDAFFIDITEMEEKTFDKELISFLWEVTVVSSFFNFSFNFFNIKIT